MWSTFTPKASARKVLRGGTEPKGNCRPAAKVDHRSERPTQPDPAYTATRRRACQAGTCQHTTVSLKLIGLLGCTLRRGREAPLRGRDFVNWRITCPRASSTARAALGQCL